MSEVEGFNFADYIKPTRTQVVVELVKEEETAGGIYVPESIQEKAIGLPVVAVGPDVDDIKVGDLIMPLGHGNVISLFGKEWLWVDRYDIMAIVSPQADAVHKDIMKAKAAENDAKKKASMSQIITDTKHIN